MKKNKSDETPNEDANESREAFTSAGNVAHIEKEFAKVAQKHNKIDTYFQDEITDPEWTELKRTAKFNFPDLLHAKYQDLSARQKLWAIAECEGWSKSKFATLSGNARATITAWSRRADFMLFARDYMHAQGTGNPSKEYAQMAHAALKFYAEVLEDKPYSLDEKAFKFKVAQYVTDRAHGPIGKTEIDGVNAKQLVEELRKLATDANGTETVDELFEDDSVDG
jgi:hypothetical protein